MQNRPVSSVHSVHKYQNYVEARSDTNTAESRRRSKLQERDGGYEKKQRFVEKND